MDKRAWVDRTNQIIAFHPIQNSIRVEKEETVFWKWVVNMTHSGYRIM